MGRSDFSWRSVFSHVFGSRTTREQAPISPPLTPIQQRTKRLRLSKSFLIFRSPPRRPSREFKDDNSSFMSPMPRELRSRSFDGSDIFLPSSSDESDAWDDSDEADSVRLSFINCSGMLNFFPEPPIITRSQTPTSRRRAPGRLPVPVTFHRSPSSESVSNSGFSRKRTLKQVQDRSPNPFVHSIRHGPLQYSTTSIPFDLLSRTHRLARSASAGGGSNTAKNSPRVSFTSSSGSLQSSPASHRSPASPSLARSRSCNLLSRSRSPELCLMTARSTFPLSRRLSTSTSLQDFRSTSASQNLLRPLQVVSSSPSPSSRLAMAYVPGLEQRLLRTSHDSEFFEVSNPSGSHVPFGTLRF